MKKFISIMTIAALFAVSCDKATVGAPAEVEVVTPGLVKYTLTVNKPEDTKVAVDAQGSLTWEGGEVLTISCEAWEQTYQSDPVVTISQDGKQAAVTFSAPEHEGENVVVSLGSVAASVEGSQDPVLLGIATVEGLDEGQTGKVTLYPVAAHFRFTDIPEGVQKIKIAAVGGESVANEEAKLITVTGISGTECGVNILPGTYSTGLVLAFEGTKGAIVKSLSYDKALELSANSLRNISLSGASPVQLAGTVTPVTTYTNKENDLAKRLKIYGASVADFAASNLSASLADFVEFAGYTCEGKTATTDGVFADDFTVGNHTVVAAYNFVCGDLTVSLGSLKGTAVITGLPYEFAFSTSSKNYNANETSNEGWILHNTGVMSNQLWVANGGTIGYISKEFYAPANIDVNCTTIHKRYGTGDSTIYADCVSNDSTRSTSNSLSPAVTGNLSTNGYNGEVTSTGSATFTPSNKFFTISNSGVNGPLKYLYIHKVTILYK